MKSAIAVIGAGYGDEGKGLAIDYFARGTDEYTPTLVVRCNGGAQAGHTVVALNERYVFSHIGAGTLAGADTHLSSNFIANPPMFREEFEALHSQGVMFGLVTAHPDCRVTTVYDVALNGIQERARGNNRHGSCGMGINETVTRDRAGYRLSLETVQRDPLGAVRALEAIHDEWVPNRLAQLGLTERLISDPVFRAACESELAGLESDPTVVATCLRDDIRMRMFISRGTEVVTPDTRVLIEGAQGLALDEHLGEFPHVTRSITGLPSSIRAAAECGVTSIHPVYITRAYQTRHGAGPLKGEGEQITLSMESLLDETNVLNEWQGYLRLAPLNLFAMKQLIRKDLERGRIVAQAFGIEILEPRIFLTCLDLLGDTVTVLTRDEKRTIKSVDLPSAIQAYTSIPVSWTSIGPSADNVAEYIS